MIVLLIIGGLALIALIAVVVGIVDAAHARAWREVAADRRGEWEARRPEFHGPYEAWDED
ncbi:hypothetical protein [Pseudonocardia sp.]|uniref:hypothetical protein n=1 Tax=Pseudonocardia sp. TaxID=60912 RepID=UPI00260614FC|nr:hypothetical protein [Pseudonocardia sp.]